MRWLTVFILALFGISGSVTAQSVDQLCKQYGASPSSSVRDAFLQKHCGRSVKRETPNPVRAKQKSETPAAPKMFARFSSFSCHQSEDPHYAVRVDYGGTVSIPEGASFSVSPSVTNSGRIRTFCSNWSAVDRFADRPESKKNGDEAYHCRRKTGQASVTTWKGSYYAFANRPQSNGEPFDVFATEYLDGTNRTTTLAKKTFTCKGRYFI